MGQEGRSFALFDVIALAGGEAVSLVACGDVTDQQDGEGNASN